VPVWIAWELQKPSKKFKDNYKTVGEFSISCPSQASSTTPFPGKSCLVRRSSNSFDHVEKLSGRQDTTLVYIFIWVMFTIPGPATCHEESWQFQGPQPESMPVQLANSYNTARHRITHTNLEWGQGRNVSFGGGSWNYSWKLVTFCKDDRLILFFLELSVRCTLNVQNAMAEYVRSYIVFRKLQKCLIKAITIPPTRVSKY
jgi:hypothetical protein